MFNTNLVVFVVYIFVAQALSHPLIQKISSTETNILQEDNENLHRMLRSVHLPSIVAEESLVNDLFAKIRTPRSAVEECEKLSLCKLHAKSQHSFIDTFELYFVNKENAQLWDHRTHTVADCERMFGDCNEGESKPRHPAPPAAAPRAQRRDFRTDYSEEEYY